MCERFDSAMGEDLNTPEVIAALFESAGRAGREISEHPEAADEFASLAEGFEEIMTVLGFDLVQERTVEVDGVLVRYSGEPGQAVVDRAAGREAARREKEWATADRLRDELHADGWAVEDTPEGPVLSPR
jgi:cysteinyl-tRNA synthetase